MYSSGGAAAVVNKLDGWGPPDTRPNHKSYAAVGSRLRIR